MRAKATAIDCASFGRAVHARDPIIDRLEARKTQMPFINVKVPNIQLTTDKVSNQESVLIVEDYSLAFDKILLENVSFSIQKGEKIAIAGPNGAGKTSLLRDV